MTAMRVWTVGHSTHSIDASATPAFGCTAITYSAASEVPAPARTVTGPHLPGHMSPNGRLKQKATK